MVNFLIAIGIQSLVVLYVFPMIDKNFKVNGDFKNSIIIVLIFLVLNSLIRWFFLIFTLGLAGVAYLLTFGILGLIVNAVVLLLISRMFPSLLSVPGFFSAFIGGALLASVNLFFK